MNVTLEICIKNKKIVGHTKKNLKDSFMFTA